MNKIIQFIKDNIKDNNEIHVSYEFSKIVEDFDEFKPIEKNFENDIIGDYNFGYLTIIEKTYPIFSNILFEFDEIEFK
ncbi:MAG: hypothetical protein ACOCP8_07440 [archaeon]